MFAGHYAPAFALRARFPDVPLWGLFVAVQTVDVLLFTLVPLGLARWAQPCQVPADAQRRRLYGKKAYPAAIQAEPTSGVAQASWLYGARSR